MVFSCIKLSLSLLLYSFLSNTHQTMIIIQETIYKMSHFPTIILSRKRESPFTKLTYITLLISIKTQVTIIITWFFTLISSASFIFSFRECDVTTKITNSSNNIIQKPRFQAMELNAFQAALFSLSSTIHGRKREVTDTIEPAKTTFDAKLKCMLLNLSS